MKRLRGVHVEHRKNTSGSVPKRIPTPAKVWIPMSQHIGAPCSPVVKVGDLVEVGQLIGSAAGFVSAPIHASVSGKVTAIEDIVLSGGQVSQAVVITSDGQQTVSSSVVPPVVETFEQFTAAIRASGVVGLGGAGFPTSVKLSPKDPSVVEYVIINAAECEPYITSDLRTMLDRSDDVLAGIAAVRKFLGVKNVIIGIETNKPEAIRLFEPLSKDADISIAALPSMYPQGGEKVLIYNITGRVVPEGKLPLDVGVIVLNVTTTAFIGSYLRTGMPLVEKCITVDGSAVGEPQNVIAPIGTPLRDIFAFCGGYKKPPRKILMGGPMMGIAVTSDEVPLLKNNNAVLALDEKDATLPEPTPCIRCGRCIEACPVNLMPTDLEHAYEQKNVEMLERLHIGVCMECGCCSYVCPARRNLVQANKLSKALVREKKVKK